MVKLKKLRKTIQQEQEQPKEKFRWPAQEENAETTKTVDEVQDDLYFGRKALLASNRMANYTGKTMIPAGVANPSLTNAELELREVKEQLAQVVKFLGGVSD